jgi:hypothetical protein
MKRAGLGLMSATISDMQDWVDMQPDATYEERGLAFRFLMRYDAMDIAVMLGL